jgi:hypothetical protein
MRGIHTLRPVGEIDLATADAVLAEWADMVDRERPATVIVDPAEVTFIDSSGLSARRARGGVDRTLPKGEGQMVPRTAQALAVRSIRPT